MTAFLWPILYSLSPPCSRSTTRDTQQVCLIQNIRDISLELVLPASSPHRPEQLLCKADPPRDLFQKDRTEILPNTHVASSQSRSWTGGSNSITPSSTASFCCPISKPGLIPSLTEIRIPPPTQLERKFDKLLQGDQPCKDSPG